MASSHFHQDFNPRFVVCCHQCDKLVEFIDWNYNITTREYEIVVMCHGFSYTKRIPVDETQLGSLKLIEAFGPKDGYPPRPGTVPAKKGRALCL